MPQAATRGRPRLRQDAQILDAALGAFAASGYEAMSVRALNAELGLSHGAIQQRFGSKMDLYRAAIDHGFDDFFGAIADERARVPVGTDDFGQLRSAIRGFLLAAAHRPELGQLMNQEGLRRTERLDYIVERVFTPAVGEFSSLLTRLADGGVIHPTSSRTLFFLVAHGAEAPYTLRALSEAFDSIDGPLDSGAHADAVTDLIMRGLRHTGG